jgi:hypothetical protein
MPPPEVRSSTKNRMLLTPMYGRFSKPSPVAKKAPKTRLARDLLGAAGDQEKIGQSCVTRQHRPTVIALVGHHRLLTSTEQAS